MRISQLNLGFTNVYRCISELRETFHGGAERRKKRVASTQDERAETAYNVLWQWHKHLR
ncbi:hypothetical protein ALO54_200229 [Pseudomonas syringae pv. philadelphi]|nr:hypothetical protein ALO54_200229 [Pseudomonas syringae pv. philadelphi]